MHPYIHTAFDFCKVQQIMIRIYYDATFATTTPNTTTATITTILNIIL